MSRGPWEGSYEIEREGSMRCAVLCVTAWGPLGAGRTREKADVRESRHVGRRRRWVAVGIESKCIVVV